MLDCLYLWLMSDQGYQWVHQKFEPVSMLPEGQNLSKSAAGPPLKWVEEHGITPDCGA